MSWKELGITGLRMILAIIAILLLVTPFFAVAPAHSIFMKWYFLALITLSVITINNQDSLERVYGSVIFSVVGLVASFYIVSQAGGKELDFWNSFFVSTTVVLSFGALMCIFAEKLGKGIRDSSYAAIFTYMLCVCLVLVACAVKKFEVFPEAKYFGLANLFEAICYTIAVVFFYEAVKPRLRSKLGKNTVKKIG